jgi:hypothetical protein
VLDWTIGASVWREVCRTMTAGLRPGQRDGDGESRKPQQLNGEDSKFGDSGSFDNTRVTGGICGQIPGHFQRIRVQADGRVFEKQGIFEKQGTRGNLLFVSREGVSCTKTLKSWYTASGRVPRRDFSVHNKKRLSVVTPSLQGCSRAAAHRLRF